jgi:hypothetical protein
MAHLAHPGTTGLKRDKDIYREYIKNRERKKEKE